MQGFLAYKAATVIIKQDLHHWSVNFNRWKEGGTRPKAEGFERRVPLGMQRMRNL